MAYCSSCGNEVQPHAKFCPECGTTIATTSQSAPKAITPKPRRPVFGLLGIILLLIGILIVFSNVTVGLVVGLLGLFVLIGALITGNVKMFG